MKLIIALFIGLAGFEASSEEFFRSVSFALTKISSDTNLKNTDKDAALTFSPNVATGFGVGVETRYLALAYVFAGSDADKKSLPKSKYSDFLFNFSLWRFDIRLNLQRYKGAYVDSANELAYYDDYELRSRNMRVHYYFMPEVLKFVRDGKDLTQMAATNEGTKYFASPFAGVAVDSRTLKLPQTLTSNHQSAVDSKGIHYSQNFEALTLGPLLGCDFVVIKGPAFFRVKAAAGAGFQVGGRVVELIEIALNLGLGFAIDHSIALSVDSYSTSFRDNSKLVENSNTQAGIIYNYALW